MTTENASKDIRFTRVYDAPVQMVWDAWIDPKQAANWWGPRGFTITTHSKDLRPGGHWAYTMHGPDGVNYPNRTIYYEVETCSRLVYDHGGNDDQPPLFRVTVTFQEIKDKTKMSMSMTLPTPEAATETRQFIKQANGYSTWDRLAEYLGEKQGQDLFVINRSFPTTVAKMYDIWSKPEYLAKWLPPTGFTMTFMKADITTGGSSHYKMTDGKTTTMYGRVFYHELKPTTQLIYSQEFCDENGNISRHPHAPTWPASMHTIVTLAEENPQETRVTVRWEPGKDATPNEIATFLQARSGMDQGWTGSFNKLEELLTSYK